MLIARYPSAEAFSAAVGSDPTYIRNIRNGVRNLGDKVARQIEDRLGLANGSLDLPNLNQESGSQSLPTPALVSLLLASYPGLSREDADKVLLVAETLSQAQSAAAQKPAKAPQKRGSRKTG